jgi:predicted transcriptional regulator
MVQFVLEEVRSLAGGEDKVPFSSSLPDDQFSLLALSANRLNRDKALLIRAAIHALTELDPRRLERLLMSYYHAGRKADLRPFTTTLTIRLKERVDALADRLHRSKADLIRAALHQFLTLPTKDQAKAVR